MKQTTILSARIRPKAFLFTLAVLIVGDYVSYFFIEPSIAYTHTRTVRAILLGLSFAIAFFSMLLLCCLVARSDIKSSTKFLNAGIMFLAVAICLKRCGEVAHLWSSWYWIVSMIGALATFISFILILNARPVRNRNPQEDN